MKLGPKSIWLRFNPLEPSQYYVYEVWDSETKAVKEVRTMWYEVEDHYIPSKKRSHVCSRGARRDKGCWSCKRRHVFYEALRAQEKQTGIRIKPSPKPPVDAGQKMVFGCTVMENIFAVPKIDSSGAPMVSRQTGQTIMQYVPESLMGRNTKGISSAGFGRRVHVSVSRRGLNQLLNLDDYFCNRHCANCASAMTASSMTCPGCENVLELPSPLTGSDLQDAISATDWSCDHCDHVGHFSPDYSCECGKPAPGWLTCFDVKIRAVKDSDEDKSTRIEITAVRMPKIESEEVMKMVMNSLEIQRIFVPESLDRQANLLGDLIKGLDNPMVPKRGEDAVAPPSQPYGNPDGAADGTDDIEDDVDAAEF